MLKTGAKFHASDQINRGDGDDARDHVHGVRDDARCVHGVHDAHGVARAHDAHLHCAYHLVLLVIWTADDLNLFPFVLVFLRSLMLQAVAFHSLQQVAFFALEAL